VKASLGENLVAVCDVRDQAVEGSVRLVGRYNREHGIDRPLPAKFFDYREMFDKMGDRIDAVFVATPDNLHAPASQMAIRRGKHVYCEKPLTHDIDEARQLTLAARDHHVATQMGNQGRAEEGWRLLAEYVWAGALGDIGCHALSGIYTALKMESAEAVELVKDAGDTTDEMFPSSSIIRWDIPARADMPPCRLFWYDGGYYPPAEVGDLASGQSYPSNGKILVGDRGKMTFYGTP
jgi:hypothetical protein